MTSAADALHAADTGHRRGGGLGYLAGLDGLRGLAVSAVFLFHAEVLDGGFLGVDVFFAISGFLITALAVGEIERTGRLSLAGFWARRARRLLPALFLLCGVVVLWSMIDGPPPATLAREVVSTLAYVANWSRLGEGYEYFAAYDEPSLLEHTWSLAVEEQFYLVWPVALVACVALARRRGWSIRVTVGVVAAVAAVASSVWAWRLADAESPQFNRLYFGTDTRAVGLAVGCVAGCILAAGRATGERRIGPLASGSAVVGAIVLATMMVVADGAERWLYGWGFALAALASIALVNAASGIGPVGSALGIEPLARVGRVSYGVYLWHWPVIVVLDHERTGLSGPAIGALWIAVTAAFTIASWYLVEKPAPLPTIRVPMRAVSYGVAGVALAVAAVVTTELRDRWDSTELVAPAVPGPPPAGGPVETTPVALDELRDVDDIETPAVAEDEADREPDAVTTTTSAPLEPPEGRALRLLILGDSIAESLKGPPALPLPTRRAEVAAVNRSRVACPVTWQGQWAFDDGRLIGDPPLCDGDDRFQIDVDEVEPDVILLMFGWPGTIAGRELPDGRLVNPCEPEFDTSFGDELERLVERFESQARVVVATVAPPTEFRDPDQSDRPGCLNRVIRERDLDVWDFGDWLCPDGDCAQAVPLLRDTIHFADTDEVRQLVWPPIVEQVLDAAGY